jgi:hypothetical protein
MFPRRVLDPFWLTRSQAHKEMSLPSNSSNRILKSISSSKALGLEIYSTKNKHLSVIIVLQMSDIMLVGNY